MLPILFLRFLKRKINLRDIKIQLYRDFPADLQLFRNCHLGMIAIDQKSAARAVIAFRELYRQGEVYLRERGHTQVWGSTLTTNRKAINFLTKAGFSLSNETDGIVYYSKRL